jgi:hypothetical protein
MLVFVIFCHELSDFLLCLFVRLVVDKVVQFFYLCLEFLEGSSLYMVSVLLVVKFFDTFSGY